MNLNAVANGVIPSVNPLVWVSIQTSAGNSTNADYTRTPAYNPAVRVRAQVQPISDKDKKLLEGLNLQGKLRGIYINGQVDGLIRPTNKGGDLITFEDGSVWLVHMVLEGWDLTACWCKVAATLQNDAPADGQS